MQKKLIFLSIFTLSSTLLFGMNNYDRKDKEDKKTNVHLDKTQREEAYKKGLEYYNYSEFEAAFKKIEQAAENDHIDAQYLLATMYLEGKGCEKDLSKAISYCSLAFKQGKKEAEGLWFQIVTEFVKKFGSNKMQLVLDPSMLGGAADDDDDDDSPKAKDKKKSDKKAIDSMFG